MITKTIPISVRIIKSFQCKIALPFVFDLKEKSIETETTRTLLSNYSQNWCHGVVVITTVQLHSTKPELRFCAGSNPARLVGDSRWWGSLTMVPAGNKAKRLLSVNHTTKTIHHHLHHQKRKTVSKVAWDEARHWMKKSWLKIWIKTFRVYMQELCKRNCKNQLILSSF